MRHYAGVLFDLGGTLFHDLPAYVSERNQYAALGCVGLAAPQDGAAWRRALSAARRQVDAQFAQRNHYLHVDLVRAHFLLGTQLAGMQAPAAQLAQAGDVYCELQREAVVTQLRLRADCHETLAALRAAGCYLAVVSNNCEAYLQPLLRRWRLTARFDHWLSSDVAASCKPDPGIFRVAARRSGYQPAELLYVGDSVASDVVGSCAAGFDVALLHAGDNATASPTDASAATYVVRQLAELVPIVNPG